MSDLLVENLRKSYQSRDVVQGISLHIKSGEVVGLLGPNGAGKTTTFYMIVGLLAANGGRILLDGKELSRLPIQKHKLPSGIPCISYIKGESESASIAAASIIAKVSRDSIMKLIDKSFPLYNLEQHKGYGTSLHTQTLQAHGASIIHRTTYLSNFIKPYEHENKQQSLFL